MEINRHKLDQRTSEDSVSVPRDVPSFIEARPPLFTNPFMRPKPAKGTNLLELLDEDAETEEPELVKVFLRLKPCKVPSSLYEIRSERNLVTYMDTATAGHGRRTQHNVSKMYTFSHIFGPDTCQKELFDQVVKENLKKLPEGHSFTLLTYGASGSGKTYSLMGTVCAPGLIPRSLEYLFKNIVAEQEPLYKPCDGNPERQCPAMQEQDMKWVKRLRQVSAPLRDKYRRMSANLVSDMTASQRDIAQRSRFYVWVSFVEIYNEAVYDLLVANDRRSTSKLRIREDTSGNVYVKGARQAFVRSGEEAYDVLVAGKLNLQVAATGVHAHSSRSHCIFTITLLVENEGSMFQSSVRLCDLAGSERATRTLNSGTRMQESRAINSSLHVLERCLHILRRNQMNVDTGLVPYRESKLTRLLGAGLSGSKGEAVSMVVTINPDPQFASETRHVLQLAAVAKDIHVNNTIADTFLDSSNNSTINTNNEIMKLRADNERLHFELAQAQAQYKQMVSLTEEKQLQTGQTIRELVEEAKDFTKQFYEAQMNAAEERFRMEKEEIIDEYEERLRANTQCLQCTNKSPKSILTPNKDYHKIITELSTEIALLQEQIQAERLARERAEDEVQHLRQCIEQRDLEKPSDIYVSLKTHDSVLVVKDIDQASNDDMNESLEPSFRIEHNFTSDKQINDTEQSNEDNDSIKNIYDYVNSIGKGKKSIKMQFDRRTSTYVLQDSPHNRIKSMDSNDSDIHSIDDDSMESLKTLNKSDNTLNDDSKRVSNDNRSLELFEQMERKIDYEIKSAKKPSQNFCSKMSNDESIQIFETEKDISDDPKSKLNDTLNSTNVVGLNSLKSDTLDSCLVKNEPFRNNEINDSGDKIILAKEHANDIISDISNKNVTINLLNKSPIKNLTELPVDSLDTQCPIEPKASMKKSICNENDSKINDSNVNFVLTKNIICLDKCFNANVDKNVLTEEQTLNSSDLKVKKDIKIINNENQLSSENKDDESTNKLIRQVIGTSETVTNLDDNRSPSIVKDELPQNYNPSTIKKLLGDRMTITKKPDKLSTDIFDDSPKVQKNVPEIILDEVEDFHDISKDISKLRATEFDAIFNDITSNDDQDDDLDLETKIKQKSQKCVEKESDDKTDKNEPETTTKKGKIRKQIEKMESVIKNEIKPNKKDQDKEKKVDTETQNDDTANKITFKIEDIENIKTANKTDSTESEPKYNLRNKTLEDNLPEQLKIWTDKRSTRLRKQRGLDGKLKDLANLQQEFSDVTLGVPVPSKAKKESPNKIDDEIVTDENCPVKSVTKSRRKLFTPRAEPLDDSPSQANSNERICVPRPSYHRGRSRRKL